MHPRTLLMTVALVFLIGGVGRAAELRVPFVKMLQPPSSDQAAIAADSESTNSDVVAASPRSVGAGDGLQAAFTKMDDELLKVRLRDQGCRRRAFGCARLRRSERLPGGFIPLARGRGDVVDVGAFAKELIEKLVQAIHEDRRSFPT